ncbi:unnamed protein product [Sphenostylis stenocarpa]|uniref:VQ domain-containing protein n=1 Tax=Sphenostylis stenocarpa TaxID=92480 RepID=A0AA86VZ94_9FABA|nr:unnamed protein product [Sphenostylis stenocarpa]
MHYFSTLKTSHPQHSTANFGKSLFQMGEAPKIVQIETRYVETDAVNFRDVVQSLTGKNSSTDWIGQNLKSAAESCSKGGIAEPKKIGAAAAATNETLLPSSSSTIQMYNDVSFKDLDEFVWPPIEMMPWSYS